MRSIRRPMKTALATTALGLLAVSAWSCTTLQTVKVHRAALVQPPAPPMWSGKTRPSGLSAGNSTVVWNDAPERAGESKSGLYVSSIQFDGNLHFSLGPTGNISLWLPFSYGLPDYAFAAAPCLTDKPADGMLAGGVGVAFSKSISSRWYIGTSIETQLALIPSQIATYSEQGQLLSQELDSEVVPVLRWSGALGVDFGWVRLFGSLGLRNHPTNTEVTTELAFRDHEGEVEVGPLYGLAGLGAEFDLGDHVSVQAQLFQPFPLWRDDLIYGPIVGVNFDLHAARQPGD